MLQSKKMVHLDSVVYHATGKEITTGGAITQHIVPGYIVNVGPLESPEGQAYLLEFLSEAEIQKVHNWLRWSVILGVTLPDGHPITLEYLEEEGRRNNIHDLPRLLRGYDC